MIAAIPIRNAVAAAAACTDLEETLADGQVTIIINGKTVTVPAGTSVAAAVMMADEPCRFSVVGEARAPLCGMGICMECRVTLNGVHHKRSCQIICASGMEVVSG